MRHAFFVWCDRQNKKSLPDVDLTEAGLHGYVLQASRVSEVNVRCSVLSRGGGDGLRELGYDLLLLGAPEEMLCFVQTQFLVIC